ncbi:toll/interleukin-1 receptor domain-containing protein [Maioricimonas rarisocia]|nr:toll/interleukin-1 receptor domain-containing protein [Maioricimonas rarisocia]
MANVLYFLPAMKSMCTPYTGIDFNRGRVSGGSEPLFDVFLSYKAEDERFVRPVADWMLSCGIRPWFDEYLILLTQREQFARAIDVGLRRCRYAVVFLNERYAKGEGTLIELRGLIEQLPQERTLLIPLAPPEQSLDPDLRRVAASFPRPEPPLADRGQRAIAEWLAERIPGLDAGTISEPVEPEPSLLLHSHGCDWQIGMQDWSVLPLREPLPGEVAAVGDENLLSMEREIDGVSVFCTIVCGTMTADQPLRRELLETASPDAHKRDMQQLVADLAREFVSGLGSPCAGVHLIYLDRWPEIPQFAMTYWSDAWVRLYSIVLPPAPGQTLEYGSNSPPVQFDIQFFVQGTFQDYCRTTSHLDRIVRSLACC